MTKSIAKNAKIKNKANKQTKKQRKSKAKPRASKMAWYFSVFYFQYDTHSNVIWQPCAL